MIKSWGEKILLGEPLWTERRFRRDLGHTAPSTLQHGWAQTGPHPGLVCPQERLLGHLCGFVSGNVKLGIWQSCHHCHEPTSSQAEENHVFVPLLGATPAKNTYQGRRRVSEMLVEEVGGCFPFLLVRGAQDTERHAAENLNIYSLLKKLGSTCKRFSFFFLF